LKTHALTGFFKDKDGKLSIVAWPNVPILLWLGLSILAKVANEQIRGGISALATGFLLYWAYLEITDGDSSFRRVLGAVVLIFTVFRIISVFI
jgi:hypothetical protein